MSDSESLPVPALPDRSRPFRWGYYAARILIVVLLLAVAAVLPTGRGIPEKYRYREGEIARERVVAPYDFRVEKDEPTLRREQQQAAASIPPVYVVDARASSEALARYAQFEEKALALVLDSDIDPDQRAVRLRGLGVPLSDESATALAASGRTRRVLRELGGWLHDLYQAGIVPEKRNAQVQGYNSISLRDGETEAPRAASLLYDTREALDLVDRKARTTFDRDPAGLRLAHEIAAAFVQPDVDFDRAETEWRRIQAQGVVPSALGMVQKDELIVDANQRVSREQLLKLRSLRNLELARKGSSEFIYPPVARMLLMLLFIAVFVVYLRVEIPAVYRDNSMLGLFALLTTLVLGVAVAAVDVFGVNAYAVPIGLAPLVVGSLLEKRPALVFSLLMVVMVMSVGEMPSQFVPVAVMGSVTAAYSVTRLRHRWHFGRAFFTIALANIAAILAWDLARSDSAAAVARDVMWDATGAFGAVTLAFLILPWAEHLFGLTSDVTLLELSDLNRPILKRLQLEAPGTYHHSMIVGSLAEAAAEAIGANSLLARVSAYYHDIGKLSKPEYYAENEPASSRSRHDRLTPSMSTLVVKSHITEGLELAKKIRLPRAVQTAIPEHHGTMVMAFFFHKALEVDPTTRREDFSYPGPRPRSRETAILMLADGVEGASRALEEPTPSRIRGLVTRIISERVADGQLDDCGLTMQDLARIREAFIPVLTAIFHVRAPYPVDPRKSAREHEARREV